MKKTFQLENLDCANCARKMEEAALKVDGVKSVSVNFLTQKLKLEADDNVFENVLEEVIKAMKNIEYECEVIR